MLDAYFLVITVMGTYICFVFNDCSLMGISRFFQWIDRRRRAFLHADLPEYKGYSIVDCLVTGQFVAGQLVVRTVRRMRSTALN